MPFASGAGVNTSLPASRSATLTLWPAVTATPFSVNAPAVGNVVIATALKASPSAGSLNPKSAVVKVCEVSSSIVKLLSVPCGASFTGFTVTVAVAVSATPVSVLAVYWKLAAPW
ncbi:hypothetical protein CDEF62S_04814 [Castellaniella defragrans]